MQISKTETGFAIGKVARGTFIPYPGAADFDTVYEAGLYAEENDILLERNEYKVAYDLGGLIVEISEGGLDDSILAAALPEAVDSAYTDAAQRLVKILQPYIRGGN